MGSRAPAAQGLRLVSDPTRAHILAFILDSEDQRAVVGELASELGLKQPTVSHHVRALFEEGILDRRPEGRRVWYSIAPARQEWLAALLTADTAPPTDTAIERVIHDLSELFVGVLSTETVDRYVRESHELLAARDGREQHLVSLTARFTAERLEALVSSTGVGNEKPEVLFVCVRNSGRSQMAAAILRQLAGDRVVVRTAGPAPATAVRGIVVTALDEIGVPLAGEYPKPLTDEVVRSADIVVTMGCGDVCPIYAGTLYLDWDLEDPAGLPLAGVRAVRDEIEIRVRELLNSLPRSG